MGRATQPAGIRSWLQLLLQAISRLLRAPRSRGPRAEQSPETGDAPPGDPALPTEIGPASQPASALDHQQGAADLLGSVSVAPAPKSVVEPAEAPAHAKTLEPGVAKDALDSLPGDPLALPDLQQDAGGASGVHASPPVASAIAPNLRSVPSTSDSCARAGHPDPREIAATTEAASEAEISDRLNSTVTDSVTPPAELAQTTLPTAPVETGTIAATPEARERTPVLAASGRPTLQARPEGTGTSSGWTKAHTRAKRPRVQHPTPRTRSSAAPTIGSRSATSVAPEKRGGRPRGPSATSQQPIPPTRIQRVPPRLVCWRSGMLDWGVGLDLPSDRSWRVRQGDSVLAEDSIVRGRHVLRDPLAAVVVDDPEGILRWSHLPAESFRAFRLTKKDIGRRALAIPAAHRLLVVVPGDWSRDPGAVEPEPAGYVLGGQWRAHHFRKRALPAFRKVDGMAVDCLHFRLGGNSVSDDLPQPLDPGPLFVGEPPRLEAVSGFRPARVVLINEDTHDRCWDEHWDTLRQRIREHSIGRFSARIYDSNHFKVQVLPFRYSARLRSLAVESGLAVPGPEGHAPARISFLHEAGCRVSGRGTVAALQVEARDETSQVSVAADPLLDHTEWQIAHDGGSVNLGVRLERTWWSLSHEGDSDEPALTARALSLTPGHFAPASPWVARVRLPRIRSDDRAQIGFDQHGARDMERLPKRREVRLPLRNLGGCAELLDAPVGQQVALQFWWRNGSEQFRATVGVVAFPVEQVTATEPTAAPISAPAAAPPTPPHLGRPTVKVGLLSKGDLFTTILTRRTGYVLKHEPLGQGTWIEFDSGERKFVASNVVVALDSGAPVVAGLLTRLRQHGSQACRDLVRHVRADWRGWRKGTERDFIVRALCVLAVVVREEEHRGTVAKARLPQSTKWLRRAEAARRNRPDVFAAIEQKYRVLAGKGTQRRGSS